MRNYSWLEDLDFSRRVGRLGRLVNVSGAQLVHLGSPAARVSGRVMGFTQVAVPYYLWRRKGVIPFGELVTKFWLKSMASNLVKGMKQRRDSPIDFRGRVVGNLIALKDISLGRVQPERAAEL